MLAILYVTGLKWQDFAGRLVRTSQLLSSRGMWGWRHLLRRNFVSLCNGRLNVFECFVCRDNFCCHEQLFKTMIKNFIKIQEQILYIILLHHEHHTNKGSPVKCWQSVMLSNYNAGSLSYMTSQLFIWLVYWCWYK